MHWKPKMGYSHTLLLAIIAVSLVSNQCSASQRQTSGPEEKADSRDVETQMVESAKSGQYDEAIQLGLKSLKHNSDDAFIYEQIAIINIIRARKDLHKRDEFVSEAISYANKALAINPSNQDIAGIHLFQIARTLEAAGDLSEPQAACSCYEQATKLLDSRTPVLKGDNVALKGKTVRLAPLRDENERAMAELRKKTNAAQCK